MTKGRVPSAAVAVVILYAVACGRTDSRRAEAPIQYPGPRYPSYLKPPTSIEEVLPHPRPLVRNKTGFQGAGLGIAQPGDTVTFVLGPDAEDLIVAAVKQSMEEVKGGGVVGDALREFMQLPHINDLAYPFHNEIHKGYWYLYEIAFGTHPKAFRNFAGLDEGTAIPERLRSGVIHWGLGITLHHDPDVQTQSQKLLDFTAKYNLPRDHGFHTHTYFSTYRVHLRSADRWVTLIDKGRLTSLDNAEVRALASRYGDPDQLLAEDWRPEIPGINAPGTYATDYAPAPWRRVKLVIDKVLAGSSEHFFPPLAAGAARPTEH